MNDQLMQGSLEWLAYRRKAVSATDIPILMKESPYKTIFQLYEEKKGLIETYDTPQMQEGRRLEPIIRQLYADEIGQVVLEPKYALIHSRLNYFMASYDGVTFDGKRYCELKSANSLDHKIAKSGKVPPKYYGQVQWQMYVKDVNEWDYVSYGKSTKDIVIITVPIDQDYITKAMIRAHEFYHHLSGHSGKENLEKWLNEIKECQ